MADLFEEKAQEWDVNDMKKPGQRAIVSNIREYYSLTRVFPKTITGSTWEFTPLCNGAG